MEFLGPVVQSVISLTSSLRVISLTVLADSIHIILIFFAEKMHCKSYSHFFSKKFQHICISLNVNFNESLTNDLVSFEQNWVQTDWRDSKVGQWAINKRTCNSSCLDFCLNFCDRQQLAV